MRRTLFELVISCLFTSDQHRARSSTTLRDFCPALIARDRIYYMIEQRSSRRGSRDGSFFFFDQGRTSIESNDSFVKT